MKRRKHLIPCLFAAGLLAAIAVPSVSAASAVQFEAVLKFMWDYNTTDFMHFETIAFATFHLIDRLKDVAEEHGW